MKALAVMAWAFFMLFRQTMPGLMGSTSTTILLFYERPGKPA
jgi:hypothetical protein